MPEAEMNFFVVSCRSLICELVSTYCADQGFNIRGTASTLQGISTSQDTFTVILHISGGDPIDTQEIEAFRNTYPDARIIVLCSKLRYDQMSAMLSSNVEAIIADDSSLRALTSVLTVVQEGFRIALPLGQTPLRELGESCDDLAQPLSFSDQPPVQLASHPVAGPLTNTETPTSPAIADESQPNVHKLSLRERTVISKLSEGASNKDIAKDLRIGESTVKVHLRSCYRKIGVRNRTQAAIWASKHMPL